MKHLKSTLFFLFCFVFLLKPFLCNIILIVLFGAMKSITMSFLGIYTQDIYRFGVEEGVQEDLELD
jgi:hypothetical protein